MAVGVTESTKTAKDFFDEFEKSPDEVPRISGAPTFLQLHGIIHHIKGNCMVIADARDLRYGKGHILTDTSILPNGLAARIPPSVRPAAMVDRAVGQTQVSWDNYSNRWTREYN